MSVYSLDDVEPAAGPITIEEGTCITPQGGFFLGDDGVFLRSPTLASKTALPQTRSMGSLSILPLEIMHQILIHVDVCTLVHFHNLNRGTLEAVTSLLPFPIVASFPRALGAMAILENNTITLPTLTTCLQSTQCTQPGCTAFGDLIYTLTARRICSRCLRKTSGFLTRLSPAFRAGSLLSDEQLRRVPRVRSVPGRFGMHTRVRGRAELLDRVLLGVAEREVFGPGGTGRVRCPEDFASRMKWRDLVYMVTIPAPYLEPETGRWERGRCCLACGPEQRFTREGMREHVAEQGELVRLDNGRVAHSGPAWEPPSVDPWEPALRGTGCPGALDFASPLDVYDIEQCAHKERQFTQKRAEEWLVKGKP